ncbi:MAG: hypothetical protein RRY78_00440 [Clostridia bacterium]
MKKFVTILMVLFSILSTFCFVGCNEAENISVKLYLNTLEVSKSDIKNAPKFNQVVKASDEFNEDMQIVEHKVVGINLFELVNVAKIEGMKLKDFEGLKVCSKQGQEVLLPNKIFADGQVIIAYKFDGANLKGSSEFGSFKLVVPNESYAYWLNDVAKVEFLPKIAKQQRVNQAFFIEGFVDNSSLKDVEYNGKSFKGNSYQAMIKSGKVKATNDDIMSVASFIKRKNIIKKTTRTSAFFNDAFLLPISDTLFYPALVNVNDSKNMQLSTQNLLYCTAGKTAFVSASTMFEAYTVFSNPLIEGYQIISALQLFKDMNLYTDVAQTEGTYLAYEFFDAKSKLITTAKGDKIKETCLIFNKTNNSIKVIYVNDNGDTVQTTEGNVVYFNIVVA